MLKRIKNALILTLIYFIIANIGNFIFVKTGSIDWTSTLWEALFFFLFIFLLQQFRTNHTNDEKKE